MHLRRVDAAPEMTKDEQAALLTQKLEVIERAMQRIKEQLADLERE